jgi:hypothetical protein
LLQSGVAILLKAICTSFGQLFKRGDTCCSPLGEEDLLLISNAVGKGRTQIYSHLSPLPKKMNKNMEVKPRKIKFLQNHTRHKKTSQKSSLKGV